MKVDQDFFSTGELAKQAGVNLQTIRYYERVGLLAKPVRKKNGYRQYTQSDLDLVLFIKNSKSIGIPLEKIKLLISIEQSDTAMGSDVKNIIENEIDEVNQKIKALNELKKRMKNLNSKCSGDMPVSSCPIMQQLKKKK